MRIEQAEAIPYALAFREPYVTARGRIDRREMVLLRLRSDTGIEGLGEAVPLSLRGDMPLDEVTTALSAAAETLVGSEVESDRRWVGARMAAIEAECALHPAVRAALETALSDLAAKRSGVPLWRLLSGERPHPVVVNATLAAGDPETVATRAAERVAKGFTTLKLKLGLARELDIAVVAAVREACGETVRIRIDANEAWTVDEASGMLEALAPLELELVEQPVAGLEAMAELRRRTGARLAADESVTDRAGADRAVELGACEAATVKLSKVGGITPALEIARRLPIYLSSALDGPVGIAAAAHTAAVVSGPFAHGLATLELFAESIGDGPDVIEGEIALGDAPGLGVELDAEALSRARISG
ncbi:mandelate racemase/muconate lactonizing enzyme family protein [Thermoleophilia bacterium SCSIO 60948]|nr:mandelate racemase/muconate lactonizing enzyme family protein [Thermoleophilia bacterium SCSIO 60948]